VVAAGLRVGGLVGAQAAYSGLAASSLLKKISQMYEYITILRTLLSTRSSITPGQCDWHAIAEGKLRLQRSVIR
jgi:hypothetical protein